MNIPKKEHKTIYEHYMANPPVAEDGHRKRGNTPQDSFWVGYDGGPARGEPTSNARLAWKAGRDTAKKRNQFSKGGERHEKKEKQGST
jgi:hypothetical protein